MPISPRLLRLDEHKLKMERPGYIETPRLATIPDLLSRPRRDSISF